MHGQAVARWVSRHTEEERFLAAIEGMDVAARLVAEQVRQREPDAGPERIREYWRRGPGR